MMRVYDEPLTTRLKLKRHATLSVDEFHDAWDEAGRPEDEMTVGDFVIPIGTRVLTFLVKGFSCVECGTATRFVAVECHTPGAFHVNFYTVVDDHDGEREIMMTRDHIIPKSKGGSHGLNNSQPMCQRCNSKKSDSYDPSKGGELSTDPKEREHGHRF